jgi:hypothetical protein
MKTILLKALVIALMAIPTMILSQVDLTIGINYAYNPPTNCNNQITSLSTDICNNGSSSAGSFLVGIYLYDPSSQDHWVLDVTTLNSLSGNACVTISNWNIDMNQYCCLPAPGSNYRIGVWADTANVITETSKNNNASLLSGNIQVCAGSTGLVLRKQNIFELNVFPNPSNGDSQLEINLPQAEKVSVIVMDVTGKKVMDAFNGEILAGDQRIKLPTGTLNNGVYFVTVSTATSTSQRKLIIQK